jgi:hypothetical protein
MSGTSLDGIDTALIETNVIFASRTNINSFIQYVRHFSNKVILLGY